MKFAAAILFLVALNLSQVVLAQDCSLWPNETSKFKAVIDPSLSGITRSESQESLSQLLFHVRTPRESLIENVTYNFSAFCTEDAVVQRVSDGLGVLQCYAEDKILVNYAQYCNFTQSAPEVALNNKTYLKLSGYFQATGTKDVFFLTTWFTQVFSSPVMFSVSFSAELSLNTSSSVVQVFNNNTCYDSADCNGYPCITFDDADNYCDCNASYASGINCETDIAPAAVSQCPIEGFVITLDSLDDNLENATLSLDPIGCTEIQFTQLTGAAEDTENNFSFDTVVRTVIPPQEATGNIDDKNLTYVGTNTNSGQTFTTLVLCSGIVFDELGTWTVRYEVADDTSTVPSICEFNVTVVDISPPVATRCESMRSTKLVARGFKNPEDGQNQNNFNDLFFWAYSETLQNYQSVSKHYNLYADRETSEDSYSDIQQFYNSIFDSEYLQITLEKAIKYFFDQICGNNLIDGQDDLIDNVPEGVHCTSITIIDSQGATYVYDNTTLGNEVGVPAQYPETMINQDFLDSSQKAAEGYITIQISFEDHSGNSGTDCVLNESLWVSNEAPSIDCALDSDASGSDLAQFYDLNSVEASSRTHFTYRYKNTFRQVNQVGGNTYQAADFNATYLAYDLVDQSPFAGFSVTRDGINIEALPAQHQVYSYLQTTQDDSVESLYAYPGLVQQGSTFGNQNDFSIVQSSLENTLDQNGGLPTIYSYEPVLIEEHFQEFGYLDELVGYVTGFRRSLAVQYGAFNPVGNLASCRNDFHVYQNIVANKPTIECTDSANFDLPPNSLEYDFIAINTFATLGIDRNVTWPTDVSNPDHLYNNAASLSTLSTHHFFEQVIQEEPYCQLYVPSNYYSGNLPGPAPAACLDHTGCDDNSFCIGSTCNSFVCESGGDCDSENILSDPQDPFSSVLTGLSCTKDYLWSQTSYCENPNVISDPTSCVSSADCGSFESCAFTNSNGDGTGNQCIPCAEFDFICQDCANYGLCEFQFEVGNLFSTCLNTAYATDYTNFPTCDPNLNGGGGVGFGRRRRRSVLQATGGANEYGSYVDSTNCLQTPDELLGFGGSNSNYQAYLSAPTIEYNVFTGFGEPVCWYYEGNQDLTTCEYNGDLTSNSGTQRALVQGEAKYVAYVIPYFAVTSFDIGTFYSTDYSNLGEYYIIDSNHSVETALQVDSCLINITVFDVTAPEFGYCPDQAITEYSLETPVDTYYLLNYVKDVHYPDIVNQMTDNNQNQARQYIHVIADYYDQNTDFFNDQYTFNGGSPHTVVYTAYDKAGNSATCTTQIQILDPHAPIMSCQASSQTYVVNNEPGQSYSFISMDYDGNGNLSLGPNELGYLQDYSNLALDPFDPITIRDYGSGVVTTLGQCIFSGSNFDLTSILGNPTQCFIQVEDEAGNVGGCFIDIIVLDNDPPQLACNDVSFVYGQGLSVYDVSITDNYFSVFGDLARLNSANDQDIDFSFQGNFGDVNLQINDPLDFNIFFWQYERFARALGNPPNQIECDRCRSPYLMNLKIKDFTLYNYPQYAGINNQIEVSCDFQVFINGFCGDGYIDLTGEFGDVEECEPGFNPESAFCDPVSCLCNSTVNGTIGVNRRTLAGADADRVGCVAVCNSTSGDCQQGSEDNDWYPLLDSNQCAVTLRPLASAGSTLQTFYVDPQKPHFTSFFGTQLVNYYFSGASPDSYNAQTAGSPHVLPYGYSNWADPLYLVNLQGYPAEPFYLESDAVLGVGRQEEIAFEWYIPESTLTREDCTQAGASCYQKYAELVVCGSCGSQNFTAAYNLNASGNFVQTSDFCGQGFETSYIDGCWYFPICSTGAIMVGEPSVTAGDIIECLDTSTITVNNSWSEYNLVASRQVNASWVLEERVSFLAGGFFEELLTVSHEPYTVFAAVEFIGSQPYEKATFLTIDSTNTSNLNLVNPIRVTAKIGDGPTDAGCLFNVVALDKVGPRMFCGPLGTRLYKFSSKTGGFYNNPDNPQLDNTGDSGSSNFAVVATVISSTLGTSDGVEVSITSPLYKDETSPTSGADETTIALLQGTGQFGENSNLLPGGLFPPFVWSANVYIQDTGSLPATNLIVQFTSEDDENNIGVDFAELPASLVGFCNFEFEVVDTEKPVLTCEASANWSLASFDLLSTYESAGGNIVTFDNSGSPTIATPLTVSALDNHHRWSSILTDYVSGSNQSIDSLLGGIDVLNVDYAYLSQHVATYAVLIGGLHHYTQGNASSVPEDAGFSPRISKTNQEVTVTQTADYTYFEGLRVRVYPLGVLDVGEYEDVGGVTYQKHRYKVFAQDGPGDDRDVYPISVGADAASSCEGSVLLRDDQPPSFPLCVSGTTIEVVGNNVSSGQITLTQYYQYEDNVDIDDSVGSWRSLIQIEYSAPAGVDNVTLNQSQIIADTTWTWDTIYYNKVPLDNFTVTVKATDSWGNEQTCPITFQILDKAAPVLSCEGVVNNITMSQLESLTLQNGSKVYNSLDFKRSSDAGMAGRLALYLEENCVHKRFSPGSNELGLCPKYSDNQNADPNFVGTYSVTINFDPARATTGEEASIEGNNFTFTTQDPSGNVETITCFGIKIIDDIAPRLNECGQPLQGQDPINNAPEVDINSVDYNYSDTVADALSNAVEVDIPSFEDNVGLDFADPDTVENMTAYLQSVILNTSDYYARLGNGIDNDPYSWIHQYSTTVVDLAGNPSTCNFTLELKDIESPSINCPQNITRQFSACNDVREIGGVSYLTCNDQIELAYSVEDALGIGVCQKSCMTCAYDPTCNALVATEGLLQVLQSVSYNNITYSEFYLRRTDVGGTERFYEQSFVDPAGNVEQCQFNIFVEDDIAPVISCTDSLDGGKVRQTTPIDTPTLARIFPNISATDDGINDQVRAIWDKTQSPAVSIEIGIDGEGDPVSISCDHTAELANGNLGTGMTPTYGCGQDNTAYSVGNHTFTFTATDGTGNTDTCTFTIEVLPAYDPATADSEILSVMFTKDTTTEGAVSGSLRYVTGFNYPYESNSPNDVIASSPEFVFDQGNFSTKLTTTPFESINCGDPKDEGQPCLEQHFIEFDIGQCGSFQSQTGSINNNLTIQHESLCLPNSASSFLLNDDCSAQSGDLFDVFFEIFAQDFCETLIDTVELDGEIVPVSPSNISDLIDVENQWTEQELANYKTLQFRYDNETGGVEVCFAFRAQGDTGTEDAVVDVLQVEILQSFVQRVLENGTALPSGTILEEQDSSALGPNNASNVVIGCYTESYDPGLAIGGVTNFIDVVVEMEVGVTYVLANGGQRRRRLMASASSNSAPEARRQILADWRRSQQEEEQQEERQGLSKDQKHHLTNAVAAGGRRKDFTIWGKPLETQELGLNKNLPTVNPDFESRGGTYITATQRRGLLQDVDGNTLYLSRLSAGQTASLELQGLVATNADDGSTPVETGDDDVPSSSSDIPVPPAPPQDPAASSKKPKSSFFGNETIKTVVIFVMVVTSICACLSLCVCTMICKSSPYMKKLWPAYSKVSSGEDDNDAGVSMASIAAERTEDEGLLF